MINIILIAIIVLVVGGAAIYIHRSKKNGEACIGCPNSKQCTRNKCGCECSEGLDLKL